MMVVRLLLVFVFLSIRAAGQDAPGLSASRPQQADTSGFRFSLEAGMRPEDSFGKGLGQYASLIPTVQLRLAKETWFGLGVGFYEYNRTADGGFRLRSRLASACLEQGLRLSTRMSIFGRVMVGAGTSLYRPGEDAGQQILLPFSWYREFAVGVNFRLNQHWAAAFIPLRYHRIGYSAGAVLNKMQTQSTPAAWLPFTARVSWQF